MNYGWAPSANCPCVPLTNNELFNWLRYISRCLVKYFELLSGYDSYTVRSAFPDVRINTNVCHCSSANWDGMRGYFAFLPWQQSNFRSKNPSVIGYTTANINTIAIVYYIPFSKISCNRKDHPKYNHECAGTVDKKQATYCITGLVKLHLGVAQTRTKVFRWITGSWTAGKSNVIGRNIGG